MSQWDNISVIASKVNSGQVKAVDLVEKSLKLIDEAKEYDAIISVIEQRAKDRAAQIDESIKKGNSVGKLAGVPFIAKDNMLTFGGETTAASNMLKGFKAPYQSTAIEKLEAEGAICVAKANLDAFAHGASTENSDFMVTKNPHDKTRVPGGSSGGSAAAVMLELAPFALGTDTGGSIRQPASFCGAVGLKPSYGLVSRSGVVAMASSTDVVGPITKTVEDTALILDIIAGVDELDSTTIEPDKQSYSNLGSVDLSKLKIGLVKEYMGEGLDESVKKQIIETTDKLKAAGANIVEVSLPSLPLSLASYYIICPAEVSSNLSRYDGQRYGHSNQSATDLSESYNLSRSEGFGLEAKRRIMIGTYVLSSGYYEAYYNKAQQLRTKLVREFEAAFKTVDFLIGPTAPTVAFKIGQNSENPLAMYMQDIMTVGPSLVGLPAISLPAGRVNDLPVGLQIIAPMRHDRQLLEIAQAAEELIK